METPVAGSAAGGAWTERSMTRPADLSALDPDEALPMITLVPAGHARAPFVDMVVEGVLGVGGMGVVTLCHQRSLGREVAVKSVHPDGATAKDARALIHEARVTGSLEHPGIVPVHHLGVAADGRPLMVMKRVTGAVWSDLIYDDEHPAWSRVRGDRLNFHLDVLKKVCDAVHFAHSRGVVHRDLKTTNVMLGEFGEVYVLDWGIACALGVQASEAGDVVGTPAFMAPEMASLGLDAITPRTDVYLLGAMLHEVLTRRGRHEGGSVLAMVNRARLSAPVAYGPGVPRELAALCNRATHPDPAARVRDARSFADALAAFQEHRASDRLTEAALARLESLRWTAPGTHHAEASQLWTEATFGFRQALESCPDNDRAAAGQREVTRWRVHHELACRDAEAAEALLATLDPQPSELVAAAARLRDELRVESAEVARLRALARDHDPRVAAGERARVAASVTVASAGVTVLMTGLRAAEVVPWTHATLAVTLALIAALAAALFRRRWSAFRSNRGGRVLVAVPFVAVSGAASMLLVGALLGLPPEASTVTALMLVAGVFGATAATFERGLAPVSATMLLAAIAGAVWPPHALDLAALAGVAASVEVTMLFRRIAWNARDERGPVLAPRRRLRTQPGRPEEAHG